MIFQYLLFMTLPATYTISHLFFTFKTIDIQMESLYTFKILINIFSNTTLIRVNAANFKI